MANIDITNRRGQVVATVGEQQVNDPAPAGTTSLSVVGRNVLDYGDEIGDNFHWLMENFANGTPPLGAVSGQAWFDISNVAEPVLRIYSEVIAEWTAVTSLKDDELPMLMAGKNLNANSNNIVNMADPINDSDGATKGYVDDAVTDGLALASDDFIGLTDTPGTYLGQPGKAVRVKASQDGLEFADLSFITLDDTPASYAGASNKIVRVNGAGNGIEFINLTLNDLPVTGPYNMGGFRLEGVGDADSADDAVNRGYGDNRYLRDTASNQQGIVVRISDSGESTARILQDGDGIDITNPDGVSGDPIISHSDTSSQGSVINTGFTVIQDIALDSFGHLTGLFSTTLPILEQSVADDRYIRDTAGNANGFVVRSSSTGESLGRTLVAGGGVTITNTNGLGGNPTISHSNTSSVGNTANAGNDQVIQDLSFDTYGHVVGVTSVFSPPSLIPEGAMMAFGGTSAPAGWLFCDGESHNAGLYPLLFAAIGTTYGSAGANTFRVPNLKGRMPIGFNSGNGPSTGTTGWAMGSGGGFETHTLTEAQLASHDHDYIIGRGDGSNTRAPASRGDTHYPDSHGPYQTENAGGNQPHNNMQPYLVTTWIIKHDETLGAPLAQGQELPQNNIVPDDEDLDPISWDNINAVNSGFTTATITGINTPINIRALWTSGDTPEFWSVHVNNVFVYSSATTFTTPSFVVEVGDEVKFTASVFSNDDSYVFRVQNVTTGNSLIDDVSVTVTKSGGGGGGGGGCLEISTPILMPNGSYKRIDELKVGDNIASYNIDGMPDESVENWKNWSDENINGSLGQATVKLAVTRSYHTHYVINGNIQVTYEHPFLIKRSGTWSWIDAADLVVGDSMFTPNGDEEMVTTVKKANTEIEVVTLNVEETDVYFAGNVNGTPVLVHNINYYKY